MGVHLLDNLASLTFQPSILDQQLFAYDDASPGLLVGFNLNAYDAAHHPFMYFPHVTAIYTPALT